MKAWYIVVLALLTASSDASGASRVGSLSSCGFPRMPRSPTSPTVAEQQDFHRQADEFRRTLDRWLECHNRWYDDAIAESLSVGHMANVLSFRRSKREDQEQARDRREQIEDRERFVDRMAESERQREAFRASLAPTAPSAGTATSTIGGGACPTTLAHLESKLPRYSDALLNEARRAVLDTDLNSALASARAQGFSSQAAAAASLQQAKEAERGMPQAEACIRAVAVSPAAVISQLQNGTFPFAQGSITSDCARGYVLAYYQMVANQEAAVALACLANR